MKRFSLFLLLAILAGFFTQPRLKAQDEKAQAVAVVVYVLQATGESPGLNLPVFPQTVSVSMLESVVANTENLQKRLENVYRYQNFTLLKTQKDLLLFSGNSKASTHLTLQKPNMVVIFEIDRPIGGQVPVLVVVKKDGTSFSRVSYLANFGKTVIAGFPIPAATSGQKTALFLAATYWERDIQSAKDYSKIIDFYKSLNQFVPPTPRDAKTIRTINQFFKDHYHLRKTVSPESILSSVVPGHGTVQLKGGHPFQPYNVPPRPIGGFAAIQRNLEYPEHERRNNIEGTVVVHVLVAKDGRVLRTEILKSAGAALDSAAVRAVKKTKWRPALSRQNGKEVPVTVWVSLPVVFRLRK